ncbi:MAG TPA: DUF2442 domain-containing protein [Candidatus Pullichristensenella excrementipullorum]|nr:DUF2442 domain-containing protein [Candidatus Pullichristensenella excrementipullorum]
MEELIHGARDVAPDAVRVEVRDGHILRVRFANGELRDLDVRPLLARKCYDALRNAALFATARVEYGVVTWADGSDLDPEWLYEDSVPVKEEGVGKTDRPAER